MTFIQEFWHILLLAGAGATALAAVLRLRKLDKDAIVDEALRRDKIETRLDSLESDVKALENKDDATMEMFDRLTTSVQEMRDESTNQHAALKDFVHGEIRRIEEKMSDRHQKLFDKIDTLRAKSA